MKRIGYFDCQSGISGDMVLGALLDAGFDITELNEGLSRLRIGGFDLKAERVTRHGISGTSVEVVLDPATPQEFRHLSDMEAILRGSDLDKGVKEKSLKILQRLAYAEAKVHGIPVEHVHFHEIGAVDTIVDVVGSVLGINAMGIEEIYASKLHVGTGTVKCAHGVLPVPAPATLELLKGVPIYSTGIQGELVTPTGAAIITTLARAFGEFPPMTVERTGYGAGKRELEIPNLLRVCIGGSAQESVDRNESPGNEVVVECNIDDMNPEIYGHVMDLLFEKGALDVFLTPVIMKKQRPGTILTVITQNEILDEIIKIVFMETTTLGVRIHQVKREKANRELISVKTRFGEVRVKVARFKDMVTNIAPEYEDCRRLAKTHGVPLKVIYDEARRHISAE